MANFLYPIYKLPGENDEDLNVEEVPTWIKWWMINNNKKRSWVLSEILTGNPLTLENSVETKFYLPPLPRGNTSQATSILPTGYSQLDYIESTGTQYISTGFKPTQNTTKIIVDGTYLSAALNYFAGLTKDGIYYGVRPYQITKMAWHNGTGSTNCDVEYLNNRLTYKYDGYKFYVNDVLKAEASQGSDTHFDIYLYLFARNNSNSVDAQSQFRMYSCKIYDNNILVRNYIPCKRNNDNEIGLYDLVNNNFVTNSGTGTFTAGNEVTVPNPEFEVPIQNVTGDVEVLLQNKNLFDVTEFDGITQNDDGTFKTTKYYVDTTEVTFKGNPNSQYTISFKENDTLNSTGFSLSVNGTWINLTNNGHKYTFTTDSNGETKLKLGAGSYALIGTSNRYIQIEQGSTATTYTPHQEQTFTFPLGTQRMFLGDYLADDGIHHVRKQIEYNGSENWSNYTSEYDGRFYCTTKRFGNNVEFELPSKFMCTHFTPVSGTVTTNGIASTKYATYINANIDGISDLAGFKTWLSTHNVTVEYELATEEITPYTTEQQQAYNEIKQAKSYMEQTNISGSSDELEPIFEVQYYMKNESEGE